MFTDFEYDGIHARDFNLIPCSFDSSSGVDTYDIGAELNFNNVSARHGTIQYITDVSYDNVLETTFQVGKFTCEKQFEPFTFEERRDIVRWLNRDEPHVLRLIGDDPMYDHIYFEGTFNVNAVELGGEAIGLELHFISNRPYALGNPVKRTIKVTSNDYEYVIQDMSDKVGHIYPKMTIKFSEDVDKLTIHNSIENRSTILSKCATGEIVTIDENLQISTNKESAHKIQNDFNYVFFRIANTYKNRINKITVSHPCEITLEYSPIIKGVRF